MAQQSKNHPDIRRINLVVDCADPGEMAAFYSKLLGWTWTHPPAVEQAQGITSQGGWSAVTGPEGQVMAFQQVEGYQPPVWPWQPGQPGQMLHLDFWVEDLSEGVAFALACGAREAPVQYYTTSKTLFDPAGHPFCIDTDGKEPD